MQRTQAVGRHDQGLDIAVGAYIDLCRQARHLRELGCEIARAHFDDRRHTAQTVMLQYDDLSCLDDAHARARRAVSCDELAIPKMLLPAEMADAMQLGGLSVGNICPWRVSGTAEETILAIGFHTPNAGLTSSLESSSCI